MNVNSTLTIDCYTCTWLIQRPLDVGMRDMFNLNTSVYTLLIEVIETRLWLVISSQNHAPPIAQSGYI